MSDTTSQPTCGAAGIAYDDLALRTCSDGFYPQHVPAGDLSAVTERIIYDADALDEIKRALFYGKIIRPQVLMQTSFSRVLSRQEIDMLHAAIGLLTEAAELLEGVTGHVLYDRPLDRTNIIEEAGDLEWYAALLRRSIGVSQQEVQQRNVLKLQTRYPDRFTETAALDRDLASERAALEGELDWDAIHANEMTLIGGMTDQDRRRAVHVVTAIMTCAAKLQESDGKLTFTGDEQERAIGAAICRYFGLRVWEGEINGKSVVIANSPGSPIVEAGETRESIALEA